MRSSRCIEPRFQVGQAHLIPWREPQSAPSSMYRHLFDCEKPTRWQLFESSTAQNGACLCGPAFPSGRVLLQINVSGGEGYSKYSSRAAVTWAVETGESAHVSCVKTLSQKYCTSLLVVAEGGNKSRFYPIHPPGELTIVSDTLRASLRPVGQ